MDTPEQKRLKAQVGLRRVVRESRIREEAFAADRAVVNLRKACAGFVGAEVEHAALRPLVQAMLERKYVPHALKAVRVESVSRTLDSQGIDVEFTATLVDGVGFGKGKGR
jgi:hypothetical protein